MSELEARAEDYLEAPGEQWKRPCTHLQDRHDHYQRHQNGITTAVKSYDRPGMLGRPNTIDNRYYLGTCLVCMASGPLQIPCQNCGEGRYLLVQIRGVDGVNHPCVKPRALSNIFRQPEFVPPRPVRCPWQELTRYELDVMDLMTQLYELRPGFRNEDALVDAISWEGARSPMEEVDLYLGGLMNI